MLAADLRSVDTFLVTGNLGSSRFGEVEADVFEGRTNGRRYLGFAKRVWGTESPSVNHLIVIPDDDDASQLVSPSSSAD